MIRYCLKITGNYGQPCADEIKKEMRVYLLNE